MNTLEKDRSYTSVVVRDSGQVAVSVVYQSADHPPCITAKVERNQVADMIADAMGKDAATRETRRFTRSLHDITPGGGAIPAELYETVAQVLAECIDADTKRRILGEIERRAKAV